MSTPALRKHFELMQRLGVRTITSPHRRDPVKGEGRRDKAETQALHEKIARLIAEGKGNVEIAEEAGVTVQTASRHRRLLVKSVR